MYTEEMISGGLVKFTIKCRSVDGYNIVRPINVLYKYCRKKKKTKFQ
jgi:hypothetical protein